MKRIFYLSSCSTCIRIIKELGGLGDFKHINIKESNITLGQLDELKVLTGGAYEDFFSKRAMKYRAMGLHEKTLTEQDIASHITSEYTFLKRPVIQVGDKVFIGNSKKTVAAAKAALDL